MRPGDDDRARAPQEVIAHRLGQRTVPDLAVEDLLELRIAARNRVADDHEIQVGRDVLRPVALECRDLLLRQEIAHRGIDVLVRSAHVVAAALQQRRERGHSGTADADQVDAFHYWRSRLRRSLRLAPLRRRSRRPLHSARNLALLSPALASARSITPPLTPAAPFRSQLGAPVSGPRLGSLHYAAAHAGRSIPLATWRSCLRPSPRLAPLRRRSRRPLHSARNLALLSPALA